MKESFAGLLRYKQQFPLSTFCGALRRCVSSSRYILCSNVISPVSILIDRFPRRRTSFGGQAMFRYGTWPRISCINEGGRYVKLSGFIGHETMNATKL